ncbi:triphosphoribosyl-dephospho-CoA synthase MdcB [Niveispirillum fermenti]|uniref:triphosphoribosyl-dephospho-CoA synthase MdcB n=1 Tax=Niveispirillum fermenti TaxID=1233113 RepID=UPI003A8BA260
MSRPFRTPCLPAGDGGAGQIGRAAVRALHAELVLAPKPGLVSPLDNGSHADMDMATFLRSLSALRPYFRAIAAAGGDDAPFGDLAALGRDAERDMLAATGGVNTHRGAIFCIGLLAAASGLRRARGLRRSLGDIVRERWGRAILAAGEGAPPSHGSRVAARHGARGARGQAAAGFPILYRQVLPALTDGLAATGSADAAGVQALFTAMTYLEDTNLLHRGGPAGLSFVQGEAGRFLDRGGVLREDWRDQALALHRRCVARWLSPGGSADMLAAVWFLWSQGDRPDGIMAR